MKAGITLFLLVALGRAADAPKVDLQAQYTSVLLAIANLQTSRVETLKQIEDENREYAASVAKLQKLVREIVQAKIAECSAAKKQIDQKALEETGALKCLEGK